MKDSIDHSEPQPSDAALNADVPDRALGRTSPARLPWLRFAAELGIIFLGVTLGLVADDWRRSREDRRDEARALSELLADLAADSIGLADLQRLLGVHDTSAMWIHQHLDDSESDPDSAALMMLAIYNMETYQAPRATYAGLRSSARLALIRDLDLRRGVTHYYEERQPYLIQYYETYRSLWAEFRRVVSSDVRLSYSPEARSFGEFQGAELLITTPWADFPTDASVQYYIDELGVIAAIASVVIGDVQLENARLRAAIRSQLDSDGGRAVSES